MRIEHLTQSEHMGGRAGLLGPQRNSSYPEIWPRDAPARLHTRGELEPCLAPIVLQDIGALDLASLRDPCQIEASHDC